MRERLYYAHRSFCLLLGVIILAVNNWFQCCPHSAHPFTCLVSWIQNNHVTNQTNYWTRLEKCKPSRAGIWSKYDILTNFQNFLLEEDQNIHLNDKFPLKITNISREWDFQIFPGNEISKFVHAWLNIIPLMDTSPARSRLVLATRRWCKKTLHYLVTCPYDSWSCW